MMLQAPRYTQQSMVDPAGQKATMINDFWHFLIITSSIVTAIVFIALLIAIFKRRRPIVPEAAEVQRSVTTWVGAATAMTLVIIVAFIVIDFRLARAVAATTTNKAVRVNVIGHQWWWEFQYPDSSNPGNWITTANELHIPVGRPVLLHMTSPDVIHSFWVPNLSGKKDLIPGHATETWIEADSAGVYRGQCAEFCGLQHAKMAMLVIAESEGVFDQWLIASRTEAMHPSDSLQKAGEKVFMTGGCAICHAIAGTPAGGHVGPDLTHLASRHSIAAASLPNNRGNLGGWIVDPQRIKPGALMPPNGLAPDQLEAILAYLEGLK